VEEVLTVGFDANHLWMEDPLRLVLVTDAFPPMRSSGAVQVRDLSLELARQGHEVTVVAPSPDLQEVLRVEDYSDVRVIRVRVPQIRVASYVRRTIAEAMMPIYVLWGLYRSGLHKGGDWSGVVCYAPSLFLGPIAKALKTANRCPSYLIIRDIFPQWALDMGLMGRGIPYYTLKLVERYLYASADVIGVQTAGNLPYFSGWLTSKQGRRLEVLQNWLCEASDQGCSINLEGSSFAGRKVIVYAGNMGRAQGMDIVLDLAEAVCDDESIGFLLVGRGSEAPRLRRECSERGLDNVLFFDEIEPVEIPGLYAQCDIGLVVLDPRHKTHNIPGKFLSYMQRGLPVLATINPGNDLVGLIREKNVGIVSQAGDVVSLREGLYALLQRLEGDSSISSRCRMLWSEMFSAEIVAGQVVNALSGLNGRKL